MKKQILFFTYLLFLLKIPVFGQENIRYHQSLLHIKNTLSVDEDYAKWMISKIDEFSVGLQSSIEYIANSNDTYSDKNQYISYTINKYFEGNLSKIEISSNTTHEVVSRTVNNYLYRLAKIKEIYGYDKVELIFRPDYLGMGTFYKVDNNTYELTITMIQVFKAWYGDDYAYTDIARKKFRLNFHVDDKNCLTNIKVNHVLVAETYNLDEYNKKYK